MDIKLPCPLSAPGACSNSCPLSQWCHSTISSSVIPFSSCPQCFPVSFPVSSLYQVAKVLEFQLQHESFPRIFRTDFLSEGLIGSPCSPRDSHESSPTPQFKNINSWCSAFFIVQLSHPYTTTGKTIALTRRTFVGKVVSLLFGLHTFLFRAPCEDVLLPPVRRALGVGWVSPTLISVLSCFPHEGWGLPISRCISGRIFARCFAAGTWASWTWVTASLALPPWWDSVSTWETHGADFRNWRKCETLTIWRTQLENSPAYFIFW